MTSSTGPEVAEPKFTPIGYGPSIASTAVLGNYIFPMFQKVLNFLKFGFTSDDAISTHCPIEHTDAHFSSAQQDMVTRFALFHDESQCLLPSNANSAALVRQNFDKVLLSLVPLAPNAFSVGSTSKGFTLLDSGASANFIRDIGEFTSYKTIIRTVNLGNGITTDGCIIGEGRFIRH